MHAHQAEAVRGLKDNLPRAGWLMEVRGYTYHQEHSEFVLDAFVENLNYLADTYWSEDPRQRQLPILLPADAERALKFKGKNGGGPRVSHIFLYDFEYVLKPKGGQFQILEHSAAARYLLAGDRPKAPGPTPGRGGEEGKDKQPDNRGGWRPPGGTVLSDVFASAGAPEPKVLGPSNIPGGPGKDKDRPGLPPRTEFIVLFIWQEPLTE
jgi:hypothetical protein